MRERKKKARENYGQELLERVPNMTRALPPGSVFGGDCQIDPLRRTVRPQAQPAPPFMFFNDDVSGTVGPIKYPVFQRVGENSSVFQGRVVGQGNDSEQ